mmetsp:Transcript_93760/g.292168  ORF Transcript_93760/g.292168 Transcript_93760/m.292168 type:complete len:206 (-) Transcript_93760:167-784(-)
MLSGWPVERKLPRQELHSNLLLWPDLAAGAGRAHEHAAVAAVASGQRHKNRQEMPAVHGPKPRELGVHRIRVPVQAHVSLQRLPGAAGQQLRVVEVDILRAERLRHDRDNRRLLGNVSEPWEPHMVHDVCGARLDPCTVQRLEPLEARQRLLHLPGAESMEGSHESVSLIPVAELGACQAGNRSRAFRHLRNDARNDHELVIAQP